MKVTPSKHDGCKYVCLDNLGGGLERSQLLNGLRSTGIQGFRVWPHQHMHSNHLRTAQRSKCVHW